MNIGYIRVSSKLQGIEPQIEMLSEYDIDKWYVDYVPGNIIDKTEFTNMLNAICSNDTIFICNLNRISRDAEGLIHNIYKIINKGARIFSVEDDIDTATNIGKNKICLINIINNLEKYNVIDKQKIGIEKAKAKGVYKGGKPKTIDKELFDNNYFDYKSGKITKIKFAENIGVSRVTLDKMLKAREVI